MGGVIDLPADAAPFGAEARGASFYVGASVVVNRDGEWVDLRGDAVLTAACPDDERGRGEFTVPVEHLSAFAAALQGVAQHPQYQRSERTPDADDPWTITRHEDVVVVSGPVYTFGVGRELAVSDTVEIDYRHLPHLLTAVSGVES